MAAPQSYDMLLHERWQTTTAVSLIAVLYISLIRCARWRYLRRLDDQNPSPADDLRTAHAIHVDTIHRDQYFLSRKGVELGLIKTFAVPSISKLLASTGEFRDNTEIRSEDVDLLVMEFLEHCPLDSSRAQLAIRRMNAIHSRYKISNEDYVYVLCVFACQAIMWIDQYGWRDIHRNERVASYVFWKYIGEQMGIQDIPGSYDDMQTYLRTFESTKMKYAKSNVEVLRPTLEFNLSPCPSFLRPLFRSLLSAMCDDKMRKALDLPAPPAYVTLLLRMILWSRGFVEEYLLPPTWRRWQRTPLDGNLTDEKRARPKFHPATACPYRSRGYRIGELGPPGLLEDDFFGGDRIAK